MPLTAKGEKILASMVKTYGSEKKAKQVLYASKNAGKITGIDAALDACAKLDARMDALVARRADVGKDWYTTGPDGKRERIGWESTGHTLAPVSVHGRQAVWQAIREGNKNWSAMPPGEEEAVRGDVDPLTIGAAAAAGGSALTYAGNKAYDYFDERLKKRLNRGEERQKVHVQKMGEHLESKGWKENKEESFPWARIYEHPEHPGHTFELGEGNFSHEVNGKVVRRPSLKGLNPIHEPTGYDDLRSYVAKKFPDKEPERADESEVILDRKRQDAEGARFEPSKVSAPGAALSAYAGTKASVLAGGDPLSGTLLGLGAYGAGVAGRTTGRYIRYKTAKTPEEKEKWRKASWPPLALSASPEEKTAYEKSQREAKLDTIVDAVASLQSRMSALRKRPKPVIPTGKRGSLANRRRAVRFDADEGPADEVLHNAGWLPRSIGEGQKEWKHSQFSRHRFITTPHGWQHTRAELGRLTGTGNTEYEHGKFEESPKDVQHFSEYVGSLKGSYGTKARQQHSALEHATAARYYATPHPEVEKYHSELSPAWRDIRPAKAAKHAALALAKGAGPRTWRQAKTNVSGELARSQAAIGKAEEAQHEANRAHTSPRDWRGLGIAGQRAFWGHSRRGELQNRGGNLEAPALPKPRKTAGGTALMKMDSLEKDERLDTVFGDDIGEWGEAPSMLKGWRRTKPGGLPQKSAIYRQGAHRLIVRPGGWHHVVGGKVLGEGGPKELAGYMPKINTRGDAVRSPRNLRRRSALEHAVGAARHLYGAPNVDPVGYVGHAVMARAKGASSKTMQQARDTVRGWPGHQPLTLKRLLGRNKVSAQLAGTPKLLPKLDAIADACAKLEKRVTDCEQKRADGLMTGLKGLATIPQGPHAMNLHVAKTELAGATKKVKKFTKRAALHERLHNPWGSDFNTLRAQHYGIAQRGAARRLGELQGA